MKSKLFFFTIFLFSGLMIFALSPAEDEYIQKILSFRLSLRTYASADEAIEKIHEFEESQREEIGRLGEEARLVSENMLRTAEYNCEYEKDVKSKKLEKILRATFEKILAHNESHKKEGLSDIFIISSADIINSMVQFLPMSEAMKLGLQEKKDYDAVLEKNPEMSLALINSALWYYFAPSFAGGSTKKAEGLFRNAVKYASNDYEKYYSAIYLSQFLFEQKDFSNAGVYLSDAEKILPGARYVPFIRKINSLGFSLYDFNDNRKREKVQKAMR